jgi:AraC-like DNA-binding protein
MQKQFSSEVNIKYHDVMLNDDFPISYFAYTQKHRDLNQLHYHDAFEIGLCMSGSGIFFIDNKVKEFKKDDISFLFPNQPHIAQSPIETSSDWIFITVDFFCLFAEDSKLVNALLLNQYTIPNIISPNDDEDILQLLKIIIHELDKNDGISKFIIKNMLLALILKIIRLKDINKPRIELHSDTFDQIKPVLTYISLHYEERISVKKMATICNLSESYFRLVFKNVIGYTPLSYLTYVRMKIAKTLLHSTNLSVITISQNVGYTTLSSFNRSFKDRFGITPTDYRASYNS